MYKVFAFVISFLVTVPVAAQDKKGRFGHYTEIGALAATKNRPDNVTTAAFTFQTVNGYNLYNSLFIGLGAALDLYATQTILPVFAGFRFDIARNDNFYPYIFADGGYGFDITSSTTTISYESGMMCAVGLGFKIPLVRQRGFHLNAGYRLQKGAIINAGIKEHYNNNRIALRAGFYL